MPLREDDRVIARLAAKQHGVVSRAQLLRAGVGNGAIEVRLRAGRLHPVHRGIYLVGHTARPALALEMAAVLACGPWSAVSHRSAGYLWELLGAPPRQVEVTVRRRANLNRPGIKIHTTRFLTRAEIRRLRGVPLTSPARTILDLASLVSTDELERLVAEAIGRKLVRRGELVAVLEANRGRTGAAGLRALLEGDGDPARTRSRAERKLLKLLRASPLPAPETNARLGPYEIDLLWRDHRLAVEVDGYSFHSGRPKFESDRLRDADLQARGFRVIRVTWRQVTREPDAVLARIGALLGETGIRSE